MKSKTKLLLILAASLVFFGIYAKTSYGSIIDTLNITFQTPPPPPTPPTKPEPSTPPTPPVKPEPPAPPTSDPCKTDPKKCPTPTPTATPSGEPTPTPTPSTGGGGGGSNSGGGGGGTGGGAPAPQTLGASTMAGTGVFEDNLFSLFFSIGALLMGVGIRKYALSSAPKK